VESPLFQQELDERATSDRERRIAEEFNRQGYVVLPGAIPDSLADAVALEVDEMARKGPYVDEYSRERRVQDAWRTYPGVRQLATDEGLLEVLRFLYGREPVPFQTLDFLVGTQQRGHSDTIHFDSLPHRFMCGVWVALEDTDPDNGPLYYHPGSHRLPEITPNDLNLTASAFDYVQYEDFQQSQMDALGLDAVEFHAHKGDALVWSANVVHGGRPIRDSGRTRRSQVTHYFFRDCLYYTPMLSDVSTGKLSLRDDLVDITTGKRVHQTYNGRPVATARMKDGRQLVFVDPGRFEVFEAAAMNRMLDAHRSLLKARHTAFSLTARVKERLRSSKP
jgi:hypothetical protein